MCFLIETSIEKQKTPQAHLSSWLRDGPRRCGWEELGEQWKMLFLTTISRVAP